MIAIRKCSNNYGAMSKTNKKPTGANLKGLSLQNLRQFGIADSNADSNG